MREHLGEEYGGVVSAVTGFGIFVTLDAMYVEGLVHITELGGEYYRFDEARQELRGERTGIRYAVGSRVRVQVSRVDLDGRRIDFRLISESEGISVKPGKEKPAERSGAVPHGLDESRANKRGKRTQRLISEPLPIGVKTKARATSSADKSAASAKSAGKTKR